MNAESLGLSASPDELMTIESPAPDYNLFASKVSLFERLCGSRLALDPRNQVILFSPPPGQDKNYDKVRQNMFTIPTTSVDLNAGQS